MICLILISFTYVAGQMRGVGIVFSQFLTSRFSGGYRWHGHRLYVRRTWRHERHHLHPGCPVRVLIFAYLVPAIFISMLVTGIPIPH